MENATKALMMAASILITIMILGLLVFTFNKIKDAKEVDEDSILTQQVDQFNKRFTAYEKEIRGNELYSLINRMMDYNATIDKYAGTSKASGHSKMDIKVTISNPEKIFNFNQIFTRSDKEYDLEWFEETTYNIDGSMLNLRQAVEVIEKKKLYKGQDMLQKIVSELDSKHDGRNFTDESGFKEALKKMRI